MTVVPTLARFDERLSESTERPEIVGTPKTAEKIGAIEIIETIGATGAIDRSRSRPARLTGRSLPGPAFRTPVRVENSFIPVDGVGEKTERRLWEHGITRWDEFDGSVVGPTTADRIDAFVDRATDRLDAGDARFFDAAFPSAERWRLYESFRDEASYFDIETTGLGHRADVTTVSFHRDGETRTLVRGRDLTAETLTAELDRASLLVSYNGIRFDVPFLERAFDRTIDVPHLDLMYPCKRLDLTGGLKSVERQVDITRDRPDLSGRDAVRLWRRYERGDEDALETLVSYNRDDAANLASLAEILCDRLHNRVFAPVRGDVCEREV